MLQLRWLLLALLAAIALSIIEGKKAHLFDSRLSRADESFDLDLGGEWSLVNSNGSVRTTGTVPGNVVTDLQAAGIIQDPYYGSNDVNYRWIGLDNWTYSRTFSVDASLLGSTKIELVAEGLDTVAIVSLNGQQLGQTDNMFRRYRFDVTQVLGKGVNVLQVSFLSAATYAAQRASAYPYVCPAADNIDVQHGEPFRNYIRKEQCSFSWDWGPCFIPQGIWQPIGLVAYDQGVLEYVTPQIFALNGPPPSTFQVQVSVWIRAAAPFSATVQAQFGAPLQSVSASQTIDVLSGETKVQLLIEVVNPPLWWPAGYGAPSLVTLQTSLFAGTQLLDNSTQSVGFRSVELVTQPIAGQNGSSMFLQVNGVPMFAKGANFIPTDSFESRVTYDSLYAVLQNALDANMNMVRNWGGGIYQHDAFYEICDQLGLMVWEEFMFGCAMIPRDSQTLYTVGEEVKHQVRRLMSHPSIVLWSGSNENEAALGWFNETLTNRDLYLVDYVKLYFDTVRAHLVSYDVSRPFWPSSPSNGILSQPDPFVAVWGNPYDQTQGDLHYYNYLTKCNLEWALPSPRFASEYGFQSLPSFSSLSQVLGSQDWFFNSSGVEHRQHHPNGTLQLVAQIAFHFQIDLSNYQSVQSFKNYIYLTQAMQALCITYQSEHYRRGKGQAAQTMGALYWQLNAIWQAPDWASIEYGGKWKMLHYAARRFFAPVLVSAAEMPWNVLQVYVTSDLTSAISDATLLVQLIRWSDAAQVAQWTAAVDLAPLGSSAFYTIGNISGMLAPYGLQGNEAFLMFYLQDKTGTVMAQNHFFLSDLANVSLPQSTISFEVYAGASNDTASVVVSSTGVSAWVWLDSAAVQGRFSDNAFLLLPNAKVVLTFFGWEPFTLEDLQQSLSITQLLDTLPTGTD